MEAKVLTSTRYLPALTAALLCCAVAASPWPAQAAIGAPTAFVVDTQFLDGPSAIVSATGSLASCTSVVTRDQVATPVGPSTVMFSGEKVLACGPDEVVVHFDSTVNARAGRKSFGDWYVISSTLTGVAGGSGTVKGDSKSCTPVAGSAGCILDTFTGAVFSG
jgi:hypothetical protein